MTNRHSAFFIGLFFALPSLAPVKTFAQSGHDKCVQKYATLANIAGGILAMGPGLISLGAKIGGEYAADKYLCDPDPEPPPSCRTDASSAQCQDDLRRREQEGPPECLVQTRALANACGAGYNAASNSCSDSQMPRSNQSSRQTSSALENSESYNATCNQARQFNDTFQKELQQFASSCEGAVTQCANACQELQARAAGCSSAQARQIAAQYQSQNASCGSGGTLATRPSQARGQAAEANAQLNQSSACAKDSQAAQAAQNAQPASKSDPSVDTTGGPGTVAQTSTVGGDSNGLSATPLSVPTTLGSSGSQSGIDTSGRAAGSVSTFQTEDVSSSGWSSGNSLAALPGTPARAPGSEEEDGTPNNEQVSSALGASGTYSGGGGKAYRPFLRPVGKVASASDDPVSAAAMAGEDIPDLNQFRPTGMTGLVRCASQVSAAALLARGGSLQCVHSPHKDIFKAVTERYERQVQDQKLYYDL